MNTLERLRTIFRTVFVAAALAAAPVVAAQNTDTTCLRTLPWSSSFEPDRDSMQCWTIIHQCGIYPTEYHGNASDGFYSLALTSTSQLNPCMIATPRMAHRADSLHVSFHLTMATGDGTLQVGLMDSTFVPLMTISATDAPLGLYEFYTDNFTSTDSLAVAFLVNDCRVCIDEVEVEAATLCRRPCQAWVDEVGIYGITVGWNSCGGTALSYILRQIDTGTNDTLYMVADDSPAMLLGMNAGTTYDIAVAALCGNDTTNWVPVGLVTTEVACRQPSEATVEALTATAAGLSWDYDNGGINTPTGMLVKITDMNSNSSPMSFSTTNDYIFADNLSTGHTYLATLNTICASDTAVPVTLTFIPLPDACNEVSGNANSLVIPLAVSSPYSYSQMLYPASMLAGMDTLYALAFNVVGTPLLYNTRLLDVYIGTTTDSTLNANISTMTSQRVTHNLAVAPQESGWMTLPFEHPIAVNQQRNLLITIADNTGAAGGQLRFSTHHGSFGGTLYGTSTEMPFSPTETLFSLTQSNAVADLQLFGNCAAPSCVPPAAMVTAKTDNTLTISWVGTNGNCAVRYRVGGSDQWQVSAPHTGSCTLQGLNPATRYELQVGTICGGDTAYSAVFEAVTSCGIVAVPYLTDFTQGANPCWQGYQNTFAGGVRLGSMIISPEIGQAANTLQVTLLLAGYGELYLGVCDADGENMQWIDTLDVYLGSQTVYLNNYIGTSRRIALVGSSASVQLLEVLVEQLADCLPPLNLTVTNVNGYGATLTWQGYASLYEIHLTEVGSGQWNTWQTAATQHTLSGLAGNTDYEGWVNARCGNDVSASILFHFTTDCENIAYFPYNESFESPQAPAQCWHLAYADPANAIANPIIHTTEQACHGVRSLRFSSYNYVASDVYNQYLISPRIVSDDSIWIHFRYRKDNIEQEPFAVGFSTWGNNIDDFLWMNTEQAVAGQWLEYNIGLPAATRYVAIHYMGQNSYYLYIDDLRITGPGCVAPAITMVDEQSNQVSIGWTAEGDTSYVAITDGLWMSDIEGTAVVTNEHTFSGLESSRRYTVGVRSRCPDGHLSDWTTQQVATINPDCTAPTNLAANSISYTSADIEWQPTGDAQRWQLCLLADDLLIGIYQPVNMPFATIVGLEQGVSYSVLVRSLCDDFPGPWSDTLVFTTLDCATVSNVTYERIDFRTVSLSWQEAPISTGIHRVEYGPQGFTRGNGTVVELPGMPLTIGNLEPEPDYDFYIQNYCQPGVLSDDAAMITVPTGLGIDEADSWSTVAIYPNPATKQINVSGIANGSTIEVLDVTGRVLTRCTATDNLQIDVSHYAAGTYFVRIVDNTRSAVGKFTVKR